MKLPLSWIKEYTAVEPKTYKEFEHALTMSGSKVEGFLDIGGQIKNVKTGKITKTERHPDADKLTICQVDLGDILEPVQIVTAATNMKEGDIVPVALHKSTIFGGHKIEKTKLRGVPSAGMFCSKDELGIGDPAAKADGLLILSGDVGLGQDIVEVLGLNDAVFEFEITSNRPDCLSAVGLARETAATYGIPFNLKAPVVLENGGNAADMLKVTVKNPEACKRYIARIVTDIKIGPSPEWLQRKLSYCGVRPINNIVDITNYVMLEYGQPMHAFDIKSVDEIVVRNAEKGEKITTLDGIERELSAEMLVIADSKAPVAVAGVMGGEFSGINDDTNTIVFESANFFGTSVRKTAQKLGLRTESSGRFEKGLDKEMTLDAINRACELINQLDCGKVVTGIIDIDTKSAEKIKIPFSPEKINKFLGTDISEAEMAVVLQALEFTMESGTATTATPPDFRIDIHDFCDVAEEVARIYGYDKIPTTPLSGSNFDGGLTRAQALERSVKIKLCDCGFSEIYTYSFETPKAFDMLNIKEESSLRNTVKIINPLGVDMSIMRTTPLFGMLSTLLTNEKKRAKSAYLFEMGKTYKKTTDDELPIEETNITIGAYGETDFFRIKGAVIETLKALGIRDAEFTTYEEADSFHPYKTAKIFVNGEEIGIIGQIHPTVQQNFSLSNETYVSILYFSKIVTAEAKETKYKELNKYPASEKDFSVVVDENVTVAAIEKTAKKVAGKLMTSIELFDVYRGNQIPEGKKSVSFSFMLEDFTKTLTDEETNGMLNKIIEAIAAEHGALLR